MMSKFEESMNVNHFDIKSEEKRLAERNILAINTLRQYLCLCISDDISTHAKTNRPLCSMTTGPIVR